MSEEEIVPPPDGVEVAKLTAHWAGLVFTFAATANEEACSFVIAAQGPDEREPRICVSQEAESIEEARRFFLEFLLKGQFAVPAAPE